MSALGPLDSVQQLLGFRVRGADGEVGRLHDVYFDDHRWVVRYLVVDTGHWLAGRRVLLSPISVLGVDRERGRVNVGLTRDQVRRSPDIDTHKPVNRQHEIVFHTYFALPFYWAGGDLWGLAPYPSILRERGPAEASGAHAPMETAADDPHLRSFRALCGYLVLALDDEVGRLEDFLMDRLSWALPYALARVHPWPAGRHVPVPTARIAWVSWLELAVHVALEAARIRSAPPHGAGQPLAAEDAALLAAHYGRAAR